MDTNAPPPPRRRLLPRRLRRAAAAPPRPHHRLRRDRANGILGGVAAGIAETYGLDVTLVRVLWVVAGVLWIGVPAYIVAWIAIRARRRTAGTSRPVRATRACSLGLGARRASASLIAEQPVLPHGFRFDHFGAPLLLIGGGLAILLLPPRATTPTTPSPTTRGPRASSADDGRPTPRRPSRGRVWADASRDRPTRATPAPTDADHADAADVRRRRGAAAVPPSAWTQTAPWPTATVGVAPGAARRAIERRAPTTASVPHPAHVERPADRRRHREPAPGDRRARRESHRRARDRDVPSSARRWSSAAFVGRAHTPRSSSASCCSPPPRSRTRSTSRCAAASASRTYRPLQLAELKSHYELGIGKLELDLRDVAARRSHDRRRRAGRHRRAARAGPELGARRSARARRRGIGEAVRTRGGRLARERRPRRRRLRRCRCRCRSVAAQPARRARARCACAASNRAASRRSWETTTREATDDGTSPHRLRRAALRARVPGGRRRLHRAPDDRPSRSTPAWIAAIALVTVGCAFLAVTRAAPARRARARSPARPSRAASADSRTTLGRS